MKRTLSLVLALVMVLGTFTGVFAQDVDAEVEAGLFLAELGVLKGDLEGDLGLGKDLKRRDAVVMLSRLMDVEEVAANFPGAEEVLTFKDLKDEEGNFVVNDYYASMITWAVTNEYFKGDHEGNFNPDNAITAREYLTVLLRALGYGDVAWGEVMETAVEVGLVEDTEEFEFTRGTMAVLTVVALNTNLKDSDETLAEKLEIELPEEEVTELEVVEVVADNLKEVKVVFNQEVDADTVTDSNVKVDGKDGSVTLSDDGVTAVITVKNKLDNQGEYKVIVDKVESVSGVVIEKTEIEFKAFDATLPTVDDVIVTGPRNLTVVFSEPIEKSGKVEVKQDKLTLGNNVKVSGNKVNVEVFTNFVDGKEYEVTVKEFEDYAGYKNVINTLTFTYEKDETPPVATIEKVEQEYVVVSFNKPVKGISPDKFYHTFSAWKAVSVKDADDVTISTNDSVNEVYVYFYEGTGDKGIPAGGTVFGILGKDIKDNWGNALGNQEFEVTAVADRTEPEVESITVRAEDTIRVTFSKNVKFEEKNIEILDDAGKEISGMYLTVTGVKANVYDVKMSKKMAGKVVTVSIKDVADTTLFGNVLSLHTETIEITDKTAPKVSKLYYNLDNTDTSDSDDIYKKAREIYVVFDEAVDAETALKASNYSLVHEDEDVTVLTASPSFDALNNRVKLPLTAAQANDLGPEIIAEKVKLQIINVKDLAGNAIKPGQHKFDGDLSITDNVTYKVKATGTRQLVVVFEDILSNISLKNFTIDGHQEFTLTQEDSATKTTLTFDISKDEDAFNTDATGIVFAIGEHEIKNSYGNKAEFPTVTPPVADEIKPEIRLHTTEPNKGKKDITVTAATYGKIDIVFTEAMDENTFSNLSFVIEGKTVKSRTWNGNVYTIELNEEINTTEYIRLNYEQTVKDLKGNNLNHKIGEVIRKKADNQ